MAKSTPKRKRQTSAARQLRIEALSERIGYGPIYTGRLVRKHSEEYGIAIRTAWDDHRAALNLMVELSQARITQNHARMETHAARMLGRAEVAANTALDNAARLLLRAAKVEQRADEAEDDDDDHEAKRLRGVAERLEQRGREERNSAANMIRSMAPMQARLIRIQGLGELEARADVVDTIVVFDDLPLPSNYLGPATTPASLDSVEIIDAEIVDADP